eukprot:TRINITY_DN16496_c0_g1_i6.p1 TRINITY_DN16496_c0_g1~~TRINITY_DN16496_c0_g1_i6.p1  ORF type:complete len:189 (+),score=59.85 TRINITY_DN16496_c0_g1_i6:172-738(+)
MSSVGSSSSSMGTSSVGSSPRCQRPAGAVGDGLKRLVTDLQRLQQKVQKRQRQLDDARLRLSVAWSDTSGPCPGAAERDDDGEDSRGLDIERWLQALKAAPVREDCDMGLASRLQRVKKLAKDYNEVVGDVSTLKDAAMEFLASCPQGTRYTPEAAHLGDVLGRLGVSVPRARHCDDDLRWMEEMLSN